MPGPRPRITPARQAPSPAQSPEGVIGAFVESVARRGWVLMKPEGLVVPYFRTEFNRCLEHRELNRMVAGSPRARGQGGWYQVSVACRTNDMRKVESGWHSTVFEMMVGVGSYALRDLTTAIEHVTSDAVSFLVKTLGLATSRLRATYFGGGEVVPGVELDPDDPWRRAWIEAGVSPKDLIPVQGPKNYVLFVGRGERCGPKCELMYAVDTPSGVRWVEIGTLIVDQATFEPDGPGRWRVVPSQSIAAGIAYGVDRLNVVRSGVADMTALPPWAASLARVEARAGQRPETFRLMRGDALILVDQVRATHFLLAAGAAPDDSPRGRLIAVMLRRIRRKVAALNVADWSSLIDEIEAEVLAVYGPRYPQLANARGAVQQHVREVPWPEGWNPESYGSE